MKGFFLGITIGIIGLFALIVVFGLLSALDSTNWPAPPPARPALAEPAPAAPSPTAPSTTCDQAGELARIVIEAKRGGVPEREVIRQFIELGLLRESYIIDAVFEAPRDTPEWMIVGEVMRECRHRTGERDA